MFRSPPNDALTRGLSVVCEDAMFAIAAAGHADEDVLYGLGKRRADVYESVLRGADGQAPIPFREWMITLCIAIAPIEPPVWMPMSQLIKGGITALGGARGLRALFTSKPSDKHIEHVRRVGALAVRVLVAVLAADGDLDSDEQDLRAALIASLGLAEVDQNQFLVEDPHAGADWEIDGDLESKLGKELIQGAWLAAAGDGIDPREERIITTMGAKLALRPEDIEAARTEARKAVDDQRDVGAAVIDAIRYILVDKPELAATLGKLAARLFLPRRHRLEPLSALHQRSTITLANRYHIDRVGQSVVLAVSWLAALHTDPSVATRVSLLLRHEDIARDLKADATGVVVRENLDRVVQSHLQVAALAAGS